MFPVEGLAYCCYHPCAFVGQNEYQGTGGCNGAVSVSGKSILDPWGAQGGARGGL